MLRTSPALTIKTEIFTSIAVPHAECIGAICALPDVRYIAWMDDIT